MKICYFGDYDPQYSRNKVIIKGLKENGVEVIECNDLSAGKKKYCNLIKKLKKIKNQYDFLIVGYSNSRWLVLLARLLSNKPIIWDAFYSLYDNWIFDRKLASPYSIKAFYYWFLDWFCSNISKAILLTTNADIEYFVRTFHISKKKFVRVLVGFDENVMYLQNQQKLNDKFIVGYHGRYIPVLGTEYIIEAAKILQDENIHFNIVGRGQEFNKIKKLSEDYNLNNISFIPPVSLEELSNYIAKSDIYLGLLSDVPRVARAIPNKIFEASAMGKASINADTPAIREIFTDGQNILLCQIANPQDLAKKILMLKNDQLLREKIAHNAYQLIQQTATSKVIGADLLNNLKQTLNYYDRRID